MDSNLVAVAVIAVLIGFSIASQLLKRLGEDKVEYTYSLRPDLLSPAELLFFEFLTKHLDGNEYHIAIKVRLADIFKCHGNGKNFYIGFGKIKAKHFDYVIVNKKTSKILVAIELDDRSHSSKKALKNDKFKNKLCESTGLNIIRVPAKSHYSEKTLELFNL